MDEVRLTRDRWVLRRDGPAPEGHVIAVDPGSGAGSSVVLRDRQVVWSVSWTRRRNKAQTYRVAYGQMSSGDLDPVTLYPGSDSMRVAEVATLWDALAYTAAPLTDEERRRSIYVVERIVPQARRLAGYTTLAEAAGIALAYGQMLGASVAPAAGRGGVRIDRPVAGRWRTDVLRIASQTTAEVAAETARSAVMGSAVAGSRRDLCLDVTGCSEEHTNEHLAEAVCIGLWAAGYRLRREGK